MWGVNSVSACLTGNRLSKSVNGPHFVFLPKEPLAATSLPGQQNTQSMSTLAHCVSPSNCACFPRTCSDVGYRPEAAEPAVSEKADSMTPQTWALSLGVLSTQRFCKTPA